MVPKEVFPTLEPASKFWYILQQPLEIIMQGINMIGFKIIKKKTFIRL